MSERFPASIVRATPVVPSLSSASGVWTMEQQLQAQAQGIWPLDPGGLDPYFDQVSLLLHGDGTNGAQNNTFLNVPPSGVGSYAGYFDGNLDYILTGTEQALGFGTGDFTIECWAYLGASGTTNGYILFDMRSQGGSEMRPSIAVNSAGALYYWTQATTKITGGTFPVGRWNHVAVARSSGSTRMFLNGVQTGSTYTDTTDYGASSRITIGNVGDAPSSYNASWNGYVSNFRVVKGTAIYTSNFTAPTSPLTAISGTSFLTLQNATFVDNSANAFSITAGGNSAIADSGTASGLVRNGNATQGSYSPFGTLWSNYFDGNGDYLTTASSSLLGTSFTVEFFIYFSSYSSPDGGLQTVFQTNSANTATGTFQLIVNYNGSAVANGSATFFHQGSNKFVLPADTFALGRWYHIALVRNNGTDLKIYVDGVVAGSATINAGDQYGATDFGYRIGTQQEGAFINRYFNGYMSNLRVVNGTALYTGSFTPPGSPLTAVSGTTLLTCQSNRIVDNSATATAITRNGDVAVSRFSPLAPSAAYDTSVIGGSMYFDGTGDSVSFSTLAQAQGAFPGTGAFTIEAWVNPSSTSWVLVSALNTSQSAFWWEVHHTGSAFNLLFGYWGDSSAAASTSALVPTNAWTHVVVQRRSDNTIDIYYNGVAQIVTNGFYGGYIGANITPTAIPKIGDKGYNTTSALYISNFRFTPSQVYSGSFTPSTTPLTRLSNTTLLLQGTNAAIFDNAMQNDIETVGTAQINTSVKKFNTGSLYINGSGNRLVLPTYSLPVTFGSGDFTVEAWVYRTVSATQTIICGQADLATVAGSSFIFQLGSGTSDLYIGATGYGAASPSPSLNQWSHVAWVRNSASFKTYLDGVQVGSVAVPATGALNVGTATYPTTIGAMATNGNPFTGYIDDFRITKGYARYTANFTPPTVAFKNQ